MGNMTRSAAMAYGRQIGCRYYVKNTNGGLYGGYVNLADAEDARRRFEKELRNNPWMKGENVRVYIEEV